MIRTRLTELLGLRLPVIQGGLAHLALADLCAAVTEAGGLGQITAGSFASPEEFRKELRRTRELTRGPIGANFALGRRDMIPYLDVALEEGVPAITITGGNPEPLLRYAKRDSSGPAVLVLVAGVRAARKAEAVGADAVIAVGYEGGGHLGRDDTGTVVLVPRVVEAVQIPVIASGGFVDGRGLAAALALGAEGIEMGTRFTMTQECRTHERYRELALSLQETDTLVVERSLGRPARVFKTPHTLRVAEVEARGATPEELYPLIAGSVNQRLIYEGDAENGFAWGGQAVGLIHDVPSVAELFKRIQVEFRQTIPCLSGTLFDVNVPRPGERSAF